MIAAEPIEAFDFGIGTFPILHPKVEIGFAQRIISLQHGILLDHILCSSSAMWKFPGVLDCIGIILHMLDIATAFKHDHFQTFFAKFLCSPTTTNTRTDYDCVISIVSHIKDLRFTISDFRFTHLNYTSQILTALVNAAS